MGDKRKMKDEEMAEEYLQSIEGDDCVIITDREERKQAFLAGLKAGRLQWHTPDARLPEEEGDYLFYLRDGEDTMYEILSVGIDENGYCYIESYLWAITDVIAWCEIPEFEDK